MEFKISQLAEACNVNKETIRYYERKSLIPKPYRNNSGYRIYGGATVKRINFIKKMQDLGFSLSEIHKLLGVVDKDSDRCQDMYQFVSEKQQDVEKKIRELQHIQKVLNELKICCPDEKDLYACPIIEKVIEGGEQKGALYEGE
ncbi:MULTISPECIES: Hg(II)-responsive transcriptional regulator [Bacillaceae]|uniref:Mercuric resistance operon regulatory protein n=1 Tax=Salimicrobium album TaxID=50717 RepID=A0A1H3E419_9BACI|nr:MULTISPECIES: Hg(II)-responsive transcriptional regulator [Bacillaceae]SDX73473.1 MerR family transcriptional regulator, mercuric resistance operon regulatory protein [Salimicrobium album]